MYRFQGNLSFSKVSKILNADEVRSSTNLSCELQKRYNQRSIIILFYFEQTIQLKMASSSDYNIFSFKYVAASFAATYFSGVVHPLELIKTRFQSHDGKSANDNLVPKYTNIRNALKVIYANEGIRGLYKGFYISLLCQASSMSFFFWNYETRKKQYEERGVETMTAVTKASIEASILTTFLTQPIWVIKTRMLLNVNKRISEFQNLKNQSLEIYRQHGVPGFLKGLQLSVILSFSGVVQMYVYEGAKILYENLKIPQTGFSEKHFLCGALSKVFSVMLSYPVTTLRTRVQQNQYVGEGGKQKYKGISDLMFRTFRDEGIRGFYKGITANLMRGISQKGIYFYFYEMFKEILFPKKSSSSELL